MSIPNTPGSDNGYDPLGTPEGEIPMSASFMNLSAEEQALKKEQWKSELAELEYEIQTIRQVLAAKTVKAQDLKRKLGISIWRELQDDVSQGFKNVRDSTTVHTIEEKVEEVSKAIASAPLYQKTESALKTTAEKTTSFLGGLGTNLSAKLDQVKNSETFKSLEEKMGSAYVNVKSKVVTSRSNSSHDLDEALKEMEGQRAAPASATPTSTPTTTPTQPDKTILS